MTDKTTKAMLSKPIIFTQPKRNSPSMQRFTGFALAGEPNPRTNPRTWLRWSEDQQDAYLRRIKRLQIEEKDARRRGDKAKANRLRREKRRVGGDIMRIARTKASVRRRIGGQNRRRI